MAEMVLKHLLSQSGRAADVHIESAATSTYEIGNDIYPPAKRCLSAHNIPYTSHSARQIKKDDYQRFDLILLMDSSNMENIAKIFGNEIMTSDKQLSSPKIRMLMSFVCADGENLNVADPYYTGDFEATYRDVIEACNYLVENI
jgi:Protein-tyrosine-phosphatase